jgi:transcription elongation factor Elf1
MKLPSDASHDNDDDLINLSVSLATDGAFLRRTCSSCGLDFKTETPPDQFAGMLIPAIQRAGLEYGLHLAGEDNGAAAEKTLTCPYCRMPSSLQNTLTFEAENYLRRIAIREIILPRVRSIFDGLEDIKGGFISISFSQSDTTLPPRPIHGPEPSDLFEVVFLCCGERAKVLEGWSEELACPACGTNSRLV